MSHTLIIMKKIFAIIFAICIILVGLFFIQLIPQKSIASLVKVPKSAQPQKPAYTLPTVTYENDTAKESSYQISLVRAKGFPPAIQQKVDAFYDTAKSETLAGAQAITQNPPSITSQPIVYTLSSKKPLVTNAGPYVFVLASLATYTGGAHDNLIYFQLAYDVRTNQEITLDQLFADPLTAYQTVAQAATPLAINAIAKKALGDRDSQSLTEEEKNTITTTAYPGLTALAENYRYWYITNDAKLVIIFPPYQIAPWSFGEQVIAIPLQTFKNSLNSSIFKM